ncbi:MAG: thioesterase family protein [Acidimicrobiales bacterium]
MTDWRDQRVDSDAYLVEVDGDMIKPTYLCGGPWSPDAQHGSAVAATLAWAVEQVETPVPMRPVRFTVDLLSPVPLTPLRWETTTVKAGKRIAVIDSALYDGERLAARASTLLMRSEATIEIPDDAAQPPPVPLPPREPLPQDDFAVPEGSDWRPPGFAFAMDYERSVGRQGEGSPAVIWMRLRCRTVAGEEPTPFQWAAAAADMGSQLGGFLPFMQYRTINADISLHINRLPTTSWIGLDGVHRVADDAIGQTTASMFDEVGLVGQMQSSVHIDRWAT